MRIPHWGRLAALTVAIFAATQVVAAPGGSGRRTGKRPTLDDLTEHTEMERRPDGRVLWKRSFKQAVPWDEYLAALQAEGPIDYDFTGGKPTMRRRTVSSAPEDALQLMTVGGASTDGSAGPAEAAASITCVPPDTDYDGDGFTLDTSPADQFPLRRGEYVADRPRVVANFTSYIEPGIDVKFNGSNTTTFESTRFFSSDLVEKTAVVETREIKKKFNTSFAFKWTIARGALPIISLDLGASGSQERSYDYTWTHDVTRTVETKFTDLRTQSENNTLTYEPYAGKVSGQVTMMNVSDYAIDVDVSNVRIAVVAYSPFTGEKYALGDVGISGSFLLGFGAGNNSASSFVELASLNTLDMMNRLAEGWVFDMEMASYTALDHGNGANLTTVISRVNQRNSRISIHYGDTTPRQYGQVSVFQPGNACLTPRDLLTQFVGASNVEFDRLASGALVVKRIFTRTNQFADRDFDTLTPAEQDQYGRWIVGFDYYTQPDLTLDLESTVLAPEDKVYFYYVTKADLIDPPPAADQVVPVSVANDGTAPATLLVTPVSTNDMVELNITTAFTQESLYSQSVGNITNPHCSGVIYGATWYGHQVTVDSRYQAVTVPNVDWYGLQVDFGGQGYRTLASIMADPASQGSVTYFGTFPDYSFKVRFRVTPAMLGSYPTRNLQVKSANPRQTFNVGYTGYDVLGRPVSCRWNDPGGFDHNTGNVSVWYKLDNTDMDLDGFYPSAKGGIDFDDANDHRFPFAPEFLDGIDNDGDGLVDEEPMACPASLKAYDIGTCNLDNRMGWYPASPNTLIERRFKYSSGSTSAWETVGSGVTSYTFAMNSDPAMAQMEVRTTYYPAGGTAHSGVNVIFRTPGADVPVFNVGPEFEAEAGKIVAPMRLDTTGSDTFVNTPVGATDFSSASADYRINVTAAGDYFIWTRVSAASSSDDSFFVTLYTPGGAPVQFGFGSQAQFRLESANPAYGYAGFGWTRVGHWNPYVTPAESMNPIVYHLVPGVYFLRIQPRELGTKLDKLRVERLCPDADGDGYTVCAGDCNDADPNVHPGHAEVCSTPVDDDCDGYVNEGCMGGGSSVLRKTEL
jgi:hypothetical protein